MATDQISFYDESLKKQIEGSFISDGKSIHVSSAYGVKSVPYGDLGACDLQQQTGDQQPQGIGSTSAWGGGNGPGANP